jgi:hypothetical protein
MESESDSVSAVGLVSVVLVLAGIGCSIIGPVFVWNGSRMLSDADGSNIVTGNCTSVTVFSCTAISCDDNGDLYQRCGTYPFGNVTRMPAVVMNGGSAHSQSLGHCFLHALYGHSRSSESDCSAWVESHPVGTSFECSWRTDGRYFWYTSSMCVDEDSVSSTLGLNGWMLIGLGLFLILLAFIVCALGVSGLIYLRCARGPLPRHWTPLTIWAWANRHPPPSAAEPAGVALEVVRLELQAQGDRLREESVRLQEESARLQAEIAEIQAEIASSEFEEPGQASLTQLQVESAQHHVEIATLRSQLELLPGEIASTLAGRGV